MAQQAVRRSTAIGKKGGVFAAITLLSVAFGADMASAASEDVRAKKSAGMGISLSGQTGVGTGLGLNGIYNVSQRVQLGVGIASSGWDGTETFEEAQKEKYKDQASNDRVTAKEARYSATVMSAEGRVFLGNSFNVSAMIGSRSVRGEFVTADDASATGERESTYNATGMISSVAIGNHWTFDNGIVLGVDWLGLASGLSTKSKVEAKNAESESTGAATARDDLKKFSDDRIAGASLHLLGMRLGWTF